MFYDTQNELILNKVTFKILDSPKNLYLVVRGVIPKYFKNYSRLPSENIYQSAFGRSSGYGVDGILISLYHMLWKHFYFSSLSMGMCLYIVCVSRFTILNTVLVTRPSDLVELVNSESRVMLLYSTREEATHILSAARDYKITGENYVWVVTQSVIENLQTPYQFPVGMLGNLTSSSMISRPRLLK